MVETFSGRVALVLGVQLPLVIGITAWLARRDGVRVNWLRIALISMTTVAVLAGTLWIVASSRFANRSTIVLTLFGTVALCLSMAWAVTRKRTKEPYAGSEHVAEDRDKRLPGPD